MQRDFGPVKRSTCCQKQPDGTGCKGFPPRSLSCSAASDTQRLTSNYCKQLEIVGSVSLGLEHGFAADCEPLIYRRSLERFNKFMGGHQDALTKMAMMQSGWRERLRPVCGCNISLSWWCSCSLDVLTDAMGCVNDYVSSCVYIDKLVQEKGKEIQIQMVCYIPYSVEHVPLVSLQLLSCTIANSVTHLWLHSHICDSSSAFAAPITDDITNMQLLLHKFGCSYNMWSWSHVVPLCLKLPLGHHLGCMPFFNIGPLQL